eukprot:1139334-Pelagomonas_calceolata.AAC.2
MGCTSLSLMACASQASPKVTTSAAPALFLAVGSDKSYAAARVWPRHMSSTGGPTYSPACRTNQDLSESVLAGIVLPH